jgi:hypothetical protein
MTHSQKRRFFLCVFSVLFSVCQLSAQVVESFDHDRTKSVALVMAGANFERALFESRPLPSIFISGEYMLNHFSSVGLLYNRLLSTPKFTSDGGINFYYYSLKSIEEGFELGMFGKYFFHSTYSQRKSNYYIGFEFRKGQYREIRYEYMYYSSNPLPGFVNSYYRVNTLKLLAKFGFQYKIKKFIFEFACPFGLNFNVSKPIDNTSSTTNPYRYDGEPDKFIFIPQIQVGYLFTKKIK